MTREGKALILILLIAIGFNSLQAKNLPNIKQGSTDKPNVIFFATDDLNTWVNPLGYSQVKTPNLDRLAEMGITFTNAHAPGVYCAPSRSAIFSGLHATSTGCYKDEIYL